MKFLPIIPVLTRKWLCLIAAVLCCLTVSAQQKKELEERRKRLMREIALTSSLLNETTRNRSATYDLYVTLQNQIVKRKQLVLTLRKEIQYTAENIERTQDVIAALESDTEQLEEEYAEMARQAYRFKLSNNHLFFLFSADGFNDAFQRWRYLKQYDEYRKKQAHLIMATQKTLEQKIGNLELRKAEKEKLLSSEVKQHRMLNKELDDKNKILQALRSDEKRLKKDLDTQEKDRRRLDDSIKDIIRSEVATKKKEPITVEIINSASGKDATRLFQSQRGKLPWPVSKGVITRRFGKQAHPTLKKIEISNNGIDIRADRMAEVRAVFEGKVVGLTFVPGYNNMLIIQHGDYYSVYSNLDEVFVKKGDKVDDKQALGKLSVNSKSNVSELHFEIWREKTRLNPADWVRR